jgi:protein-disulfide isomerase
MEIAFAREKSAMARALRMTCVIMAAAGSHAACVSDMPVKGQEVATQLTGADLRLQIERTGYLSVIVTLAVESADSIPAKQDELFASTERN